MKKYIDFSGKIKSNIWYRDSTNEWVVQVEYQDDKLNLTCRYPHKKKSKAIKLFKKNIISDLFESLIESSHQTF